MHLLQVHLLAPTLDMLEAWRPMLEKEVLLPSSCEMGARGEHIAKSLQGELKMSNLLKCAYCYIILMSVNAKSFLLMCA